MKTSEVKDLYFDEPITKQNEKHVVQDEIEVGELYFRVNRSGTKTLLRIDSLLLKDLNEKSNYFGKHFFEIRYFLILNNQYQIKQDRLYLAYIGIEPLPDGLFTHQSWLEKLA